MILVLLAACLLVFAGIAEYTFIIVSKRPFTTLYEARTKQDDFIPLARIPERMVKLLMELEDKDFYAHHGFFSTRSAAR